VFAVFAVKAVKAVPTSGSMPPVQFLRLRHFLELPIFQSQSL